MQDPAEARADVARRVLGKESHRPGRLGSGGAAGSTSQTIITSAPSFARPVDGRRAALLEN